MTTAEDPAEAVRDCASVASLVRTAHQAAEQLDEWYETCSTDLDGTSPGGAIRQAAHEAAGLTVDTCPVCNSVRLAREINAADG